MFVNKTIPELEADQPEKKCEQTQKQMTTMISSTRSQKHKRRQNVNSPFFKSTLSETDIPI